MNCITIHPHEKHQGSLILVNVQVPVIKQPNPADLVCPFESCSHIFVTQSVCKRLNDALLSIHGYHAITGVSGFRSFEEQQQIFEDSILQNGQTFTEQYVALPGHSEHQTGLAIDLAYNHPPIDFIRPDFPYDGICQCFRKIAPRYGFVERYPAGKEPITGIAHEPWHFRYVGFPHSIIMTKYQFTLEEYLAFIKQFPYGKTAFTVSCKTGHMELSYLQAKPEKITLPVPEAAQIRVSGNNTDGFILCILVGSFV